MIRLVETLHSEDYICNCDHCGRKLKNVAIIQDGDTKKSIGTGCVKKMFNMDIELFFNEYVDFKKILNKIKNKKCTVWSYEVVSDQNMIIFNTNYGWGTFTLTRFLEKSLNSLSLSNKKYNIDFTG